MLALFLGRSSVVILIFVFAMGYILWPAVHTRLLKRIEPL